MCTDVLAGMIFPPKFLHGQGAMRPERMGQIRISSKEPKTKNKPGMLYSSLLKVVIAMLNKNTLGVQK